ncbi:MAG TPA: flippase [Gemmatimonadaceae bacterium]|nr:flippase [Gemmatimonadaceae bacterium]
MADDAPAARTTARPSLLRSGAFTLVASAVPLVLALVALPILTRQLGTERLGLLSLAWAWLGYATLLDFGLGRALTRLVAGSDVGDATEGPIGAFVATAERLLLLAGAVVGMIGAAIAPWYVTSGLGVTASLRTEAIVSAIIFALTVPAITAASVPRAVLEARHRFRDVNLVRLPVNLGTFGVPLLLLPFTASLIAIAALLAALRVWAWWRYATLAHAEMPHTAHDAPARAHLRPLLRAGAWMTISNVLSPLMIVADRFVIGSLVSVNAVALYAVPWEAVTKLWIVPGALTMVLFPAFSRAAAGPPDRLAALHHAGVRIVTLIVVPVCAVAGLLAPWLLRLAGGESYTGASVTVLRILAVGVAANCVAVIPFTLLQACGRARWTATVHVLESLPFVALLWFSVQRWGIVGAAAAWTARVLVDTALMTWRAQDVAPLPRSIILLSASGVVVVALACGAAATTTFSVPAMIAFAGALTIAAALLWLARSASERQVLGTLRAQP